MKPALKMPERNLDWVERVIPMSNSGTCDHYFEFISGECKCRKCHMGLLGVVNIVKGKPVTFLLT
jgi:hypothetical protein